MLEKEVVGKISSRAPEEKISGEGSEARYGTSQVDEGMVRTLRKRKEADGTETISPTGEPAVTRSTKASGSWARIKGLFSSN